MIIPTVHGDLALRNCIMDAGSGMLKVGDLGFYEGRNDSCYFNDSNESLPCPVRWMAPENLPYKYGNPAQMVRKPHTKSCEGDVWAFGLVLFELWTRGEHPFKGCDNDQLVCKYVRDGRTAATWNSRFTMRSSVNKLMKRCWEFTPNERPDFKSIVWHNLMDGDDSDDDSDDYNSDDYNSDDYDSYFDTDF